MAFLGAPFGYLAKPFVGVEVRDGVRDIGRDVCHGVGESAVTGAFFEGVG